MSKFKPSKYQKQIFEFIKNDTGNAVISAVAGSGKTTTLIMALDEISPDKNILFLAFNKSIVSELRERVDYKPNVKILTVHALGYELLKSSIKDEPQQRKYSTMFYNIYDYLTKKNKSSILEYNFNDECMMYIHQIGKYLEDVTDIDEKIFRKDVVELCNLGRLNYIDTLNKVNGEYELREIAKEHCIPVSDNQEKIAWLLIKLGIFYRSQIDYTDMIFLPNIFDIETEKYDFVFIDECQDTNACQRLLMLKSVKENTGRFIAVGDEKQAIYGFAGADAKSFKKLCEVPNTKRLPLSETYRCGSNIVNMVKHINSEIKPHKKNGEGQVLTNFSYMDVQDGDMILCRQTFPVVSLCIKYLSLNRKSYIIGSDIGKSLVNMIKDSERKSEDFTMVNVFSRLYHEKEKMIKKLMEIYFISLQEAKDDNTVVLYDEKIKVIEAIAGTLNNPNDVILKINSIFSNDEKEGICLSTIHKSKGLEANRVFILHSELMPSKYAVHDWQIEQEDNLRYVAYTRAKETLGFITDYDAFSNHRSRINDVVKIIESQHIGKPDMKLHLKLKVTDIRNFTGKYGETKIYDFIDEKGNILSKFGEIPIKYLRDPKEKEIKINSYVEFYGIIKEHKVFKGVNSTLIGKISEY